MRINAKTWACALAALFVMRGAAAQEASPANTLMELRRELGSCLAQTPIASGSQVTILFTMKRDGSLFGRPRISFTHLEGDAELRRTFLDQAERAVDSCLPLKITPAFGGAVAGRPFSITLGRPKAQQGV